MNFTLLFFASHYRYHKSCYRDFVNERLIKACHNQYDDRSPDKEAINFIIRSIKNEPEKVWTSTELHEKYIEKGGNENHISRFMNKVNEHMEEEIYVFKASGVASIIMHRQKASKMFNIVTTQKDHEDDDIELQKLANNIKLT